MIFRTAFAARMATAIVAVGVSASIYMKWDEWIVWPELRKPVLAALKDPESAQFRNQHSSRGVLCGEVNSRNSMGGFVGFTRFVSSTSDRYAMAGYSTRSWQDKTTKQIIDVLDREIAFMETRHRKPTEDEKLLFEFDALWSEFCA